ncbi:MAG: hypothetical protein MJ231_07560 [bacterium]|nr:hypothetical protein [bacterium]
MILKNKLTHERVQLSYTEFKTRFAKEIQATLESYVKTQNNKPYFKANDNFESDFYFDLQWNFNHFGNSNWYIERL